MIEISRTTRSLLIGAALTLALSMADRTGAQEATPGATPGTGGCTVPERSIVFIADLLAQPKPEVTATAVADVPTGQPVDEDTRAAVTSVVETLITCVNQGDFLRSFTLFDDEYLRRVIDPEGLMSAEVAIELGKTFATPDPVESGEETTLVGFDSVEQLPDGSVVVVFRTVGGPGRDQDDEQVDLFVLREIDGTWKIVDGLTGVGDD
jgi:hypothetical protein